MPFARPRGCTNPHEQAFKAHASAWLLIEGHADARGTNEYSLGAGRAPGEGDARPSRVAGQRGHTDHLDHVGRGAPALQGAHGGVRDPESTGVRPRDDRRPWTGRTGARASGHTIEGILRQAQGREEWITAASRSPPASQQTPPRRAPQ